MAIENNIEGTHGFTGFKPKEILKEHISPEEFLQEYGFEPTLTNLFSKLENEGRLSMNQEDVHRFKDIPGVISEWTVYFKVNGYRDICVCSAYLPIALMETYHKIKQR